VEAIVIGLAAYRLWLITWWDDLPRPYDLPKPGSSIVAKWLYCPWCSGFWWVVVLALALRLFDGRLPLWPIEQTAVAFWRGLPEFGVTVLAASTIVGLIGAYGPGSDGPFFEEEMR
jgi:hypothetical protein